MTKSAQAYADLVAETQRIKSVFDGHLALEPVEVFLMQLKRQENRVYKSWLKATTMSNVEELAAYIWLLDDDKPLHQRPYGSSTTGPQDAQDAAQSDEASEADTDVADEGNTPESSEEDK